MQRCDQRGYCVFDHYKATYDIRGNKTAMTDADLGSWSFSYDGLSELTSQTDAKSQSTTFTHDLLDRPVRRTEADLTSLWTYDGAGGAGNYGVGKPFRDCNAGTCAAANYERTYAINSLGQTTSMQLKIDGTTTYTYAMTYESGSGRLSTLTYPSGFVAKYDYNAYGYLSDIKDNATGAAIWTANTRDAELHLTEATSGPSTKPLVGHAAFDAYTGRVDNIRASNDGVDDGSVANLSYDWDSVGNLTERDDTIQGTTEKFCYDSQNRLNNYAMGASCSATGHIATIFSPAGNVQRRTDICNTSGCMTYGSG
ncbi:MAG TPA: RHS repeat domain-containing protein, partial [Rhizomicrobium sp.]|nr:RHS repeat domain-containing protein [Rhizomicrobium sp.]